MKNLATTAADAAEDAAADEAADINIRKSQAEEKGNYVWLVCCFILWRAKMSLDLDGCFLHS